MSSRQVLSLLTSILLACSSQLAWANTGYLENPQPGASESGLGVISGWHCSAREVEIFIDGESIGETGVGSIRDDTTTVCGHNRSGYALLYNFNLLEPGEHQIHAVIDGVALAPRKFHSLRSGGVPFLNGKQASVSVDNFPAPGRSTTLEWSQARQSFVVTGTASTASLNGNYQLRRVSLQTQHFGLLDTADEGSISASGTMSINGSSYRQDLELRLDASLPPSSISVRGNVVDMGFYLFDRISGNQLIVVDRGAAMVTSYMYPDPNLGWTNEIQYWVKRN